jgi:hypothetical protein
MDQEAKDKARINKEIEYRGLLSNYFTFLAGVHPDIDVHMLDQDTLEVGNEVSKRTCTIQFATGATWSIPDISKTRVTVCLEGFHLLITAGQHELSQREYATTRRVYKHASFEKGDGENPDTLEISGVLIGDITNTRELLKQMVGDALGLRYPTRSITNPEHPPRRDNGKYSERS